VCSTQKRDWKRGCVTNVQAHAASAIGPRSRKRFINRELSWLAFNERVRFLSISGTNLDEFYMVRVAGLSAQIKGGIRSLSQDGRTPAQQYRQVNNRAAELMIRQQETWQALRAELAVKGVSVLHPSELKTKDELWLDDHFSHRIFPVLTPLAVDPAHSFPFIPNGGMSLGLSLRRSADGSRMSALLPLPAQMPRFIRFPGKSKRPRFIRVEHLIGRHLHELFQASRRKRWSTSGCSETPTLRSKRRPRTWCWSSNLS